MGTICWLSMVLGVPRIVVSIGIVGIACAVAYPISKKSIDGFRDDSTSSNNNTPREITVKYESTYFERSKWGNR